MRLSGFFLAWGPVRACVRPQLAFFGSFWGLATGLKAKRGAVLQRSRPGLWQQGPSLPRVGVPAGIGGPGSVSQPGRWGPSPAAKGPGTGPVRAWARLGGDPDNAHYLDGLGFMRVSGPFWGREGVSCGPGRVNEGAGPTPRHAQAHPTSLTRLREGACSGWNRVSLGLRLYVCTPSPPADEIQPR